MAKKHMQHFDDVYLMKQARMHARTHNILLERKHLT